MEWTQRGGIFVATDDDDEVGFAQEFPDGSAAYWLTRAGSAKPAPNLRVAKQRVEEAIVGLVLDS